MLDVIIRNGRWFDGTGAASAVRNVGIRDGRVATVSAAPLPEEGCPTVLDASDRWVLPGFIDIHTHYDAEILLNPGLPESVRHGVTTVVMGNCSLSTVYSGPEDCADLFSRVEALPYANVLAALEKHRGWTGAREYVSELGSRALGPNIAAFLGHSDLRAHVMGLGRAVSTTEAPTDAELRRMAALLADALDHGLLGLSTMTSPFSRLDGERFRSARLPSTFAPWREYRVLNHVLRRRGAILQSAPNTAMPLNMALFFLASAGLGTRRALKTTLLTAIDPKSAPPLAKAIGRAATLSNRLLGSDLRWQHLPVPFEVYSDGIELVIFEEFGATAAALHLRDQADRVRLLSKDEYRRWFKREYRRRLPPKGWHRDLHDAEIVECPDPSLVGQTFGHIADRRRVHPVDAFLDLIVEYGTAIRWRTTIANHRPAVLDMLAADPGVHMGFADSGAHLRNMAFYNASLRFIKRAYDAHLAGRPFLSMERAVHRVTGELADWFGLAAGKLREGDRADLLIVDPAGLDDSLAAYREAPMEEFGGLRRMVNRNDAAVPAVFVGGELVYRDGEFTPGYGTARRTGRFLRARRSSRPVPVLSTHRESL
ncbi:N-acyl-D-glutamate deacylase [Sinosporangium album]|uniref:N-acyl-D-glutamate deacylase n=1 Tax=Sinosporangium album TaxID=504805 RepID=A0A1G7SHX3_9ACTN|nr:amidohydrolase family protein [Sinosporangium album]SDG22561.1 N-acyl-D-glutamate deacylase [Sinosporangium album]